MSFKEQIEAATPLQVNQQLLTLVNLCCQDKLNIEAIKETAQAFAENIRMGEIPDLPEEDSRSLDMWKLAVG